VFAGAAPVKGATGLGETAAHHASLERQLGRKPKVKDGDTLAPADEVECPRPLQYVWEWFHELAARRTTGGMAPNPITHADVLAGATVTEQDPTPWEVRLILRLDDTMLGQLRERS